MPERIAIIAALQREIAPLLRRWQREGHGVEGHGREGHAGEGHAGEGHGREGHGFSRADQAAPLHGALAPGVKAFTHDETLLLCGGMGPTAAARAARAAVQLHRPTLLISAGFAGSLVPHLHAADIIKPSKIIDVTNGRVFVTESQSEITLVTTMSVLSRKEKNALAARSSAQAVDMEAAAIAAVAAEAGIRFAAIKAISDPFDFEMPPLDRFIDSAGKLNLLHLLVYSVPRPRLWGALGGLGRNAARAARALAGPLGDVQAGHPALAR